jgi:hypothetical protein
MSSARTLEALWLASLGAERANVRLLETFDNVALGLCALGVYGVATFAARARRRELAIGAALGAGTGELTRAMLRQELQPVVAGRAYGNAAAVRRCVPDQPS